MIQDIDKKYYVEYIPETPKNDDYVCMFNKNMILLNENNELPCFKEIKNDQVQYLFKIDHAAYCYRSPIELDGYHYVSIRQLRHTDKNDLIFAIVTAYHMVFWYTHHQYCGACGHKMIHSKTERAMQCEYCHNIQYPIINVAIIAAVIHDGKILLTKYAKGYSHYALVAGFNEIGESLEATVKREVFEETGLHVKDIRYYASQPWGYDQNLMAGFIASLDGKNEIHLDNNELKEARWFSPEEIETIEDTDSITRTMIKAFKEGRL